MRTSTGGGGGGQNQTRRQQGKRTRRRSRRCSKRVTPVKEGLVGLLLLMSAAIITVAEAMPRLDLDYDDYQITAVSGSFGGAVAMSLSNKEEEEEQLMQADSPFSDEEFEKTFTSGDFLGRPRPPPRQTTSSSHHHRRDHGRRRRRLSRSKAMDFYGQNEFIQIYSPKAKANLALEDSGKGLEVTRDAMDDRTLFILNWDDSAGANRLENIKSCLLICMDRDGKIYSKTRRSDDDPECHFRTSFNMTNVTIAALEALSSRTYSNSTHSLSVAMEGAGAGQPKGEYVRYGREGVEHQLLFVPVKYPVLERMVGADPAVVLSHIGSRSMEHCPKAAEERRKAVCQEKYRGNKRMVEGCIRGERNMKAGPWAVKDCSSLKSRVDRKLCLREKRRRCQVQKMSEIPGLSRSKAKAMCRSKAVSCSKAMMARDRGLDKAEAKRLCDQKRRLDRCMERELERGRLDRDEADRKCRRRIVGRKKSNRTKRKRRRRRRKKPKKKGGDKERNRH